MNPEKAQEILKEAYQIEIEGLTYYRDTEKLEISTETKSIFNYLANEELKHIEYIKEQIECIKNNKTIKNIENIKIDNDEIKNIFLNSMKEINNQMINEASALNVGILLEKNSFDFYVNASKKVEDKEEIKLFSDLAQWELNHLDILQSAYKIVKDKIFTDQRFSPF